MSNNPEKNKEVNEAWEKANEPSKDYSKASESKITTPAQDDQKKMERLQKIIDARMEDNLQEIKTKQLEHGQKIDSIIVEFQKLVTALQTPQGQQQPPNAPQPTQGPQLQWNDIPTDVKADALSKVGTAIAQIIQAYKGGASQSQSPMGALGEQMINDLVRATVDDIQQRVYGIRKIPPSNITGQAAGHHIQQ